MSIDLRKLLGEARKLADDAREEKDPTRAKELFTQAERAYKQFDIEREIKIQEARDSERADTETARAEARAARQVHRPTTSEAKATGGTREVSRQDILQRAQANKLALRYGVNALSDQQRTQAEEYFPVEALFAKVLRREHLTDDEFTQLNSYQRKAVSPEYQKRADAPLVVGTDAKGGFLVPDTYAAGIYRLMAAYGPMANPELTDRRNSPRGEDTVFNLEDARAGRMAEQIVERGTLEARDLTFSQKKLETSKYADSFLPSFELLEDNEFGVLAYIYETIAEALGRALNNDWTAGDGSTPSGKPKKPVGILNVSTTTHTTATTTGITFDDVFNAHLLLDEAYRTGDRYLVQMSSGTLGYLAMTKDSDGRYLVTPTGGVPGTGPQGVTPHGIPVFTNPQIPDLLANTKVGVIGDFKQFVTLQAGMLRIESFYEIQRDSTRIASYSRWGAVALRGNNSFVTLKTKTS